MSIELLSADAKKLLETRADEWLKAAKSVAFLQASREARKMLRDSPSFFDKENKEATLFGGPASTIKAMFGKDIRGIVILHHNAFFQVKGLYSEDEAILLVQEEVRRYKSDIDYLKGRKETPESVLEYERVRIAENVRNEVWRRDQGKCVQCGSVRNLEYDHLIPLSKGGSNTARNLQLLCETCNRRKSDHIG